MSEVIYTAGVDPDSPHYGHHIQYASRGWRYYDVVRVVDTEGQLLAEYGPDLSDDETMEDMLVCLTCDGRQIAAEGDSSGRRGLVRRVRRGRRDGMSTPPDHSISALGHFTALQSSDFVKTDLELTCDDCGQIICDIEDGDNLLVLLLNRDGAPGRVRPVRQLRRRRHLRGRPAPVQLAHGGAACYSSTRKAHTPTTEWRTP